MTGCPYYIFTLPLPGDTAYNVLSAFKINTLDLSYSKIVDFERLKGIRARKLILKGMEENTKGRSHTKSVSKNVIWE